MRCPCCALLTMLVCNCGLYLCVLSSPSSLRCWTSSTCGLFAICISSDCFMHYLIPFHSVELRITYNCPAQLFGDSTNFHAIRVVSFVFFCCFEPSRSYFHFQFLVSYLASVWAPCFDVLIDFQVGASPTSSTHTHTQATRFKKSKMLT